jgi:hypothetical protein
MLQAVPARNMRNAVNWGDIRVHSDLALRKTIEHGHKLAARF